MSENHPDKLRELTRIEVEVRLQELEEELRNLRLRAALKEETNPLRIRVLRHDIARVHTLLREDELKIRRLATPREHR